MDTARKPAPHVADPDLPQMRLATLSAADPEARRDPYPRLAALRAACPVHHDPAAGAFVLPRMEEARAALADPDHLKSPDRAAPDAHAIRRRRATVPAGLVYPDDQKASMLEMDGAEHARVRGPIARALYARLAGFDAQVEAIVARALDGIEAHCRATGQRRFDLMALFAEPVPVACIGALLGVAADEADGFRDWLDGIVQTFNPDRTPEQVAQLVAASNGLAHYMRTRFDEARCNPGDDLFGDLARAQAEGAPLSDVEISFNLRGLLIAGNVTTTDLIGNAVRLVLMHPEARTRLAREPDLWAGAVEEALRLEPPVDFTWRIAGRDIDAGGCPLQAGSALYVSLRSANRDEQAFDDADSFRIDRRGNRHLAFGGGAHACPGAPLARMEARIALARLFARFPTLELDEPDAPDWRRLPGFRGLASLRVRF